MKHKMLIFTFSLLFLFLLTGCNNNEAPFPLEEKYYNNNNYSELDIATFNKLVENKESFVIFIYQPLCNASNEFNKILTEFSDKYQISFYKMSFSNLQQTNLKDDIKYYPSVVIYNKGTMTEYLDANSNDDTACYKNIEAFENWFSNYVIIEKPNN